MCVFFDRFFVVCVKELWVIILRVPKTKVLEENLTGFPMASAMFAACRSKIKNPDCLSLLKWKCHVPFATIVAYRRIMTVRVC